MFVGGGVAMAAAASRASAHALIFSETARGSVAFVAGAPVAVAGIASSNAALAAATVVAAAAGLGTTNAAAVARKRSRRAIGIGFGVRRAVTAQHNAVQQSRYGCVCRRMARSCLSCARLLPTRLLVARVLVV